MALLVLYDVCPFWLDVALQHLAVAEVKHAELLRLWQETDDQRVVPPLEATFAASMQAIVATAAAIEAFYARVKDCIPVDARPTERDPAKKSKTPRYRRIYELLRRSFDIRTEALPAVRARLREIMKYRNLAVHPSGASQQAVMHPDLDVGTEWRFVAFRLFNAKGLVEAALSIVAQLTLKPKKKFPKLVKHCSDAAVLIKPIVEQWEARYGQLYPRESQAPT